MEKTDRPVRTLVLGLGNLLLGDEGVGVHAVRAFEKAGCPEGVTVLDIGTAILDALPAIEQADRIIVVDAVKADEAPGSVYRMPLEAFARSQVIASMHGFDLQRVLLLAQRQDVPEVIVIGVEPAVIDWSLDLSPPVRDAMPTILELLRQETGGGGGTKE